ncbi:RNAse P Rpr2/Rpp21/SNM1 subunit domain-containing protein [Jimgerdemannia flammicorona]|uniref:RNAse P Rpr2/Rpp21/SNM1 subunit domain-containing protein n=2 Tax=Jimgerdemannia flammicorona TaxID=994334 RepID=A0A432ZY67_9FUNG|nr:RNAse P Rpr2/Rpp21/SNM1 subunit domain-containing protein [Jimgerdemannia flammicorona]
MARKKSAQQRSQAINENLHAYQRMSFLYQAACLMTIHPSPQPTTQQTTQPPLSSQPSVRPEEARQKKQFAKRKPTYWNESNANRGLIPLGRFYVNSMKTVGKRLVLRLDPNLKRTICKRCDTLLIPSVTSRIRIKRTSLLLTTDWCTLLLLYMHDLTSTSTPTLQPS